MPEVLVVEDETNLARFIELELGHEGYSVTLAEDGQEATCECDGNQFGRTGGLSDGVSIRAG